MILYTVQVTRPAYIDLREIGDYIAEDLQAPEAARELMQEIEEAVLSLERYPERSPIVSDSDLEELGIHWIRVHSYLIFYTIDVAEKKVHILRILYEKRNWKHLLSYPIKTQE